jgi:hypothetical protein
MARRSTAGALVDEYGIWKRMPDVIGGLELLATRALSDLSEPVM